MAVCTNCDREFDTERGMRTHRGKAHREWLHDRIKDLYVREMMTPEEVGEVLDMHRKSVGYWVREFGFQQPAKFHLEGHVFNGPHVGYPRWTHTGTGHRVRVLRLQMVAKGADPHKVFDGEYSVDHINGCPLDNREENLRLMNNTDHGRKDGERSATGYSHEEYMRALIQEPPEWVQDLRGEVAEY